MRLKKIFSLLLCSLLVTLGCSFFTIDAFDERMTMSSNGIDGYVTQNEVVTELVPGVTRYRNTGYAIHGVENEKGKVVNIFKADIKNSNGDLKLVTWVIDGAEKNSFSRGDILDIAHDYEQHHPGWIVVAGANADLFIMGNDYMYPQPRGGYISDGDNLVINPRSSSYNDIVGFKNDDSDVQLIYGERTIEGLFVHVYDENNNELGKFKANVFNNTDSLEEGDTTVLTGIKNRVETYDTTSKESDNGFYLVENPDFAFVTNYRGWSGGSNKRDAFFGKGTISKIVDSVSISNTSFAIETRNSELKQLLKVGTYVKCQYELDEAFANIKDGAAVYDHQMEAGEEMDGADSGYSSPQYPRSVFACDNNGNVFLLTTTTENGGKDGLRGRQINALMKQYGITYAYQCDGGGSVQSCCLNSDGVLDYAQIPYEGAYRDVCTANLIVKRVEEVQVAQTELTNNSCVYKVNNKSEFENISLKVTSEGYEHIFNEVDGYVNVNGLEKNTRYNYQILVDGNPTYIKGTFLTLMTNPMVNDFKIEIIDGEYAIVSFKYIDEDHTVLKSSISINGKTYSLSNKTSFSQEIIGDNLELLDFEILFECQMGLVKLNIKYDISNIETEIGMDAYLKDMIAHANDFMK